MKKFEMITLLGPTATGKTKLAVCLAEKLKGEIISADSRQVYRGMTIGTGKDIEDYTVNGKNIPYHLVDICDAGEEYNVFRFKQDFERTHKDIIDRNKIPVLCGGSGLYIEAVLKDYKLINVPPDKKLREKLEPKTDEELTGILISLTALHNISDTSNRKRLIRAIEIASFQKNNPREKNTSGIRSVILGIRFERNILKQRITERLKNRLNEGMIAEAEELLSRGVSKEKLIYYGLEYKYLAEYLDGQYNYNDMFQKLNSAIHRFSKRQMTWFRKMERDGFEINWIEGELSDDKKLAAALDIIKGSGISP